MEEWKDIPGYEGLYQVSNLGRVKSLERIVIRSNNRKLTIHEKILSNDCDKNGYYKIKLSNNEHKKSFFIHRLVAEAFIQNPDNLPCVNHKDEDPSNNHIENLEWCTAKYNSNYGTAIIRSANKNKKPVLCIENGRIFESIKDAAEYIGCSSSLIGQICNGKRKTAGGYHWEWKDKNKANIKRYKEVLCVETGKMFSTSSKASRETDIDLSSIYRTLNGKQHTAGGYHWEYVEG